MSYNTARFTVYLPSDRSYKGCGFFVSKNMNYITGASGFVGRHLKEKLNEFVTIPHDEISQFSPKEVFDTFYYLASYGNLYHQKDIKETITANLTQPFLTALKAYIYSKSFIFMSSSSVTLPHHTTYSASKQLCEELLNDLGLTNVRPYSITGVGEQKEHLIPTLIRAAFTGETIPFVSYPTHDFIDVEDVVDALLFISKNRLTGTYELGNGKPVSNIDVLLLVQEITNKKIHFQEVDDLRPYDTEDWYCKDNTLDGWKPKKTLVQSITEMVSAYEPTA